jgi:hypothetical protein
MPVFSKNVEHYSAFVNAGEVYAARINIYCGEGHRLFIRFPREGVDPPTNNYDPVNTIGAAFEPIARYPYYMDLLRNEKPVWVKFYTEWEPPRFMVYVSREPAGEGEDEEE